MLFGCFIVRLLSVFNHLLYVFGASVALFDCFLVKYFMEVIGFGEMFIYEV